MARSRIVVVEGQTYLVPRKKYKMERKKFATADDAWTHIMENIEDFGRLLEEESEEEEEEKKPEKKPKKKRTAKKSSDKD